jgi:NAD(P)-dependent dehydrogenase (short-subunit alcohol dehydrogenase family)
VLPTRFSPSAQPPDFGGRYQGRVAVVTGASSGLGAQLAVDLARAGAIVYGLARNTERLEKLATVTSPTPPPCGRRWTR